MPSCRRPTGRPREAAREGLGNVEPTVKADDAGAGRSRHLDDRHHGPTGQVRQVHWRGGGRDVLISNRFALGEQGLDVGALRGHGEKQPDVSTFADSSPRASSSTRQRIPFGRREDPNETGPHSAGAGSTGSVLPCGSLPMVGAAYSIAELSGRADRSTNIDVVTWVNSGFCVSLPSPDEHETIAATTHVAASSLRNERR